MPQHVDDLICREAHLGEPVQSSEAKRGRPERVSFEVTAMFLLALPPTHEQRPDWVIGRRRGSRLAGGTGKKKNVRLHICPVQPRQSRFCCWVIHRRRRRSSRGPCSSVCSARSVRPRGRIWSSVDLFARGGRDLPVSACPFATEWTGKKERNARRKKRVAHLCPVSRGGFESLSVRQIVLCLPRTGSWISPKIF
jgi:hypothetical protein